MYSELAELAEQLKGVNSWEEYVPAILRTRRRVQIAKSTRHRRKPPTHRVAAASSMILGKLYFRKAA